MNDTSWLVVPKTPDARVTLGQKVPDVEMSTYDPQMDEFGRFSLDEQMAHGRWTILFFYPADFTFV